MTTRSQPDATGAEPAQPRRPARPALVELASAILIVGGVLNLLLSVQVVASLAEGGQQGGVLALATIALTIATVAFGVLIRFGRAWLIAINVVAVVAFLELTTGDIVGLLFGILDTAVVIALLVERPWFVAGAGDPPESDLRSYGG